MKCLVSASQIAVIYFENNKDQCLLNVHRSNIGREITELHAGYDETLNHIKSLIGIKLAVPVYKPV